MEQKPGLYESIVTHGLSQSLPDDAFIRPLRASEASRRLSDHLRDYLQRALSSVPAKEQPSAQIAMVNELLEVVDRHTKGFPASEDAVRAELLQSIGAPRPRPQLPLSESGLYVNANRERSLQQALKLEAASADRIDLICAFLFWQGYRHLKPVLTGHLERGREPPCPDHDLLRGDPGQGA